MRKFVAGSIALLALAFGAQFAVAGSDPYYTYPPPDFACAFTTVTTTNDNIHCTWTSIGAPKYSVDTIANYNLNGGGTLSIDLDFGSKTTSIDIPLSDFPADPNGDTLADTLVSVVLRVKGLNPGRDNSQNNTFSGTWTCTITGAACVED